MIRELHVQLPRPRDLSVLTEAEFAVAEARLLAALQRS